MPLKAQLHNGDKGGWDEYVRSHPEASNYHQLGWRKVIERSFNHRTYYLSARTRGGDLQGVLPLVYMKSGLFGRFLVSVPFVNYGGLLSNSPEASSVLLDEAQAILQGLAADHLELRHVGNTMENLITRQHKVTMILSLEKNEDDQWKKFNAKLRNQIRKAIKSDLYFKSGHEELLNSFYDVFARNMRDLGTPVYTKEFFKNILTTFPDTSSIFLVKLREQVIAAAFASWHRDTLEIPWASSLKQYRLLCSNNLLYWEAIKFGIEHGFKQFDFGRSTFGEGTYKFKEQWGALPVQLNWQYLLRGNHPLPDLSPSSPRYRTATRLWQKLPVCVANMLGPSIVRNIP